MNGDTRQNDVGGREPWGPIDRGEHELEDWELRIDAIENALEADGLMAADRLGPGFGAAFVASCDLPLLRRTVVRAILDRQRTQHPAWVVPLVNGHPQPLASALPFTLLPRIERHLCAGRRDLRSLLATLAAEPTAAIDFLPAAALTAADPEGESFRDVDTAEEVARLNEAANPPSAG